MDFAEHEVLTTDDTRIAAAKNSDVTMLGLIYADEFKLITHTGLVRSKEDQLRDYGERTLRYGSTARRSSGRWSWHSPTQKALTARPWP